MAELNYAQVDRLFSADENSFKNDQRHEIDVKLDMMDFDYIKHSNNAVELRAILRKLRSGEFGRYTHLEEATERKIHSLISPTELKLRQAMKTEPSKDDFSTALVKLRERFQCFAPAKLGECEIAAKNESSDLAHTGMWLSMRSDPCAKPAFNAKNASSMLQKTSNVRKFPSSLSKLDFRKEKLGTAYRMAAQEELLTENYTIRSNRGSSLKDKLGKLIERQEKELSELQKEIFRNHNFSKRDRLVLAEREKQKGNESFEVGEYAEACKLYSRSLALDNTNAIVFCNRALTQMRLKNMNCALADVTVALQIDPVFIKARYRRGMIHYHCGRHDLALDDFNRCAEMLPSDKTFDKMIELCKKKLSEVSDGDGSTTKDSLYPKDDES